MKSMGQVPPDKSPELGLFVSKDISSMIRDFGVDVTLVLLRALLASLPLLAVLNLSLVDIFINLIFFWYFVAFDLNCSWN